MKRIFLILVIITLAVSTAFAQRKNRDSLREGKGKRQKAAVSTSSNSGANTETAKPGRNDFSIQADGVTRWFILYVPKNYNASSPAPLIFAFHGGNGGMNNMFQSRKDLINLAESKNFLLVFPNGQNGKTNLGASVWNAVHCCGDATTKKSDIEFVRVMVDTISEKMTIDKKRIHAVGFSNGAMFVHRLACEMSSTFASIATMSGTIGGHNLPSKEDITPDAKASIPMLLMHGTADTRVNYNGGFSDESPKRYDLPFKDTVSFWVKADSCSQNPSTQTSKGGKGNITTDAYPNCKNNADVIAISLQNVKHGWLDKTFAGFDGTGKAIEFFENHPKR